jgi:splicing suppressor protein 51
MVWGGGNLHGLYNREPPLPDFEKFMKMAIKKGIVPAWWDEAVHNGEINDFAMTDDWANINYAVEKSDIVEKYDGFAPMRLRMLAEEIYGTHCVG